MLSVPRVNARCVKRELALHLRIVWMQCYVSIRERARAWNLTPRCCGMPSEMMLRIASFAPLAGARMMCTCRRSYSVCEIFLHAIRDGRRDRGDYLKAMRCFLWENTRCDCNSAKTRQIRRLATNGYGLDLEMQIAAVAELGGDADLVFALALILEDEVVGHVGYHVSNYWSASYYPHSEVCPGSLGPPLYAACGPKGSNAVVSLLIRLGAPVTDRRAFVTGTSVCDVNNEESALCRAILSEKPSTVCMLLRASALTACHGRDKRFRTPDMGTSGWSSALYVAARGDQVGIVRALLEARACPSQANAVYHRDRRCVDRRSAWECVAFGHARGALVLEAFLACERRCCCSHCKDIYKCGDYRWDRTCILSAASAP